LTVTASIVMPGSFLKPNPPMSRSSENDAPGEKTRPLKPTKPSGPVQPIRRSPLPSEDPDKAALWVHQTIPWRLTTVGRSRAPRPPSRHGRSL
jgi:hypothetical protein